MCEVTAWSENDHNYVYTREMQGIVGQASDFVGLTLCEAIDRFRSIATQVHSNLIFW